jgi:hypothetical protein
MSQHAEAAGVDGQGLELAETGAPAASCIAALASC